MAMKKQPMPAQPPEERRRNFREVALGYTPDQAVEEAARCLRCKNRPCVGGCPVQIAIPDFLGKTAAGDFEGAFQVISQASSLPAVCGRVCPQENQCEKYCVRGIKGEPVAHGRLERVAAGGPAAHASGASQPGGKAQTTTSTQTTASAQSGSQKTSGGASQSVPQPGSGNGSGSGSGSNSGDQGQKEESAGGGASQPSQPEEDKTRQEQQGSQSQDSQVQGAQSQQKPSLDTEAYAQEVFRLVNVQRAQSGLSTLAWSEEIAQAAQVRAKELVEELSDADITARAKEIAAGSRTVQPKKSVERPDEVDLQQMSIFDTVREEDIIRELMEIDISRLSPVEALVTLDKFQSRLKNRWEADK